MWGLQPPLLRGVIAITLVACVGLAAAQTGRRGGGDTDASAMDETTGSVARPGKRAAAELALSDEQRGRIYEGVMRIADAPVLLIQAFALYMSFLGAAWLMEGSILQSDWGFLRLAIPAAVALFDFGSTSAPQPTVPSALVSSQAYQ